VQSVLLLGVVALLDDDEESLEAVVAELHALRTSDGVSEADRSRVGEVLKSIRTMPEGRSEADALAEVQADVMLHPYQPRVWALVAEVSGGDNESPAVMGLRVGAAGIPPRGELEAVDLAGAYAGTGKAAHAQAAVFVAPWAAEGWVSLGEAVACL